MKDKEKQNISMKEMLTKISFEPITNCNCKVESRIDYAVRKNEDNTGSMADLLNQEIEELQKEKQIEEMTKVSFSVIDNKTGEYPDLYDIALKEDWAKGLMYCDMEGFSINEDGQLILSDECGKFVYCPSDRFTVVFEDIIVLSREEFEKLTAPRYIIKPKQLRKEELDKHLKNSTWGIIDNDIIEIIPIPNEKEIRKETAEKFAKLIEFHSISKRDESGYETFTISNLCLREILREEFGFTNEELETMWEIKE